MGNLWIKVLPLSCLRPSILELLLHRNKSARAARWWYFGAFQAKMPGANFRRPKWCNFGMCAHLAFFCADLRPLYTVFAMCFCIFCSFSWRIAKTTSDVQKRSHWEELLEKQAKEERPWDFWPPELRSARPLFGNKTPLTPAKPGVLFCLGNYATVYHFQRHFLEVKSCLFRPSVLYVFLRHFAVFNATFIAAFAHVISAKFIILNAVAFFWIDSWKWHGELPLSKSCL